MARHATIQYRTELQHLSHGELYVRLGRVGLGSTVTPGCYERRSRDSLDLETDQTAEDLLRVLQVTPIHVLGESATIPRRMTDAGCNTRC